MNVLCNQRIILEFLVQSTFKFSGLDLRVKSRLRSPSLNVKVFVFC